MPWDVEATAPKLIAAKRTADNCLYSYLSMRDSSTHVKSQSIGVWDSYKYPGHDLPLIVL